MNWREIDEKILAEFNCSCCYLVDGMWYTIDCKIANSYPYNFYDRQEFYHYRGHSKCLILVGMGIMMLAGRGFELNTAKYTGGLGKRIKVGSAWSLFTYGIFFAIASIGCTFPVFLMLVSQSIMFGKFEQGLSHFVLYALGMGLVVVTISVLALISKTYLVKRLRQILPWVTRISAIMMISAGLYVIYDWLFGHHLI
ncbi:hypothetical protein FY534_12170 [Alicyclobacillus sp. TC]|nr:hypothetical protein FY534_12170 [Alicyclobacillus sp. TC]